MLGCVVPAAVRVGTGFVWGDSQEGLGTFSAFARVL